MDDLNVNLFVWTKRKDQHFNRASSIIVLFLSFGKGCSLVGAIICVHHCNIEGEGPLK